jgi:hypothetical protein
VDQFIASVARDHEERGARRRKKDVKFLLHLPP